VGGGRKPVGDEAASFAMSCTGGGERGDFDLLMSDGEASRERGGGRGGLFDTGDRKGSVVDGNEEKAATSLTLLE